MNAHFDIIRNDGRLLYEYIRGSQLYNLNTPDSDVDTSGVFICTAEELLGSLPGSDSSRVGNAYKAQISDSRHDNTWFEVGELLRLLMKSNPTVLESLFVPKSKIIGEVHPLMQMIIDNRDQFVTKQCFNPFFGYAKSQIEKARGLNKKIVNPVTERLTPYDFIYTFKGQGSIKFRDWLQNFGLHQEFCGLVNVPNMHDIYGVYYDFGAHVENVENWENDTDFLTFACAYFNITNSDSAVSYLASLKPIGYRGVIKPDAKADEIRLSSIEDKTAKPICFISYNQSGYSAHCRMYAEYQDWVKNRNQKRYESNLDKNYDSKNMMHCFRMIHMACEIAEGRGLILERTWDREFLMDVRNHKYEYDELIERLEVDRERMNQLMATSTIKERVDTDFVNDLIVEIRKKQLAI
ncbi:MAG: nucleotidyltransferase domain-containing protein [Bacteroidales bacterium]|nr:nucleotidyltransferase domain-containing protein [Bacteroidales bacterium]